MASDARDSMDSMTLRISELLKEVQLDYSPANTKIIDDVVSSIKEAIDKIPEDKVISVRPIRRINFRIYESLQTLIFLIFCLVDV